MMGRREGVGGILVVGRFLMGGANFWHRTVTQGGFYYNGLKDLLSCQYFPEGQEKPLSNIADTLTTQRSEAYREDKSTGTKRATIANWTQGKRRGRERTMAAERRPDT